MIPLKVHNPARRLPVVTVGLMALNVLAFVYQIGLAPAEQASLVQEMGLIPAEITTGADLGSRVPLPATFLTSMFLHAGLLHLLGNMLYLWVFGNNVEDATGHLGFIVFYIACGLVAAASQIAASPFSDVPMIGASGAIAGVLGAYMLLYPGSRVLTLVPIFIFIRLMYLPAVVVLGLWFLYQVLLSRAEDSAGGGGVAFFAHIGGFVAGMLLIWIFRKPPRRPRSPYSESTFSTWE